MMKVTATFQFPSNGKVCSKEYGSHKCIIHFSSFNSLQTGKCVASGYMEAKVGVAQARVSIPFKRESV